MIALFSKIKSRHIGHNAEKILFSDTTNVEHFAYQISGAWILVAGNHKLEYFSQSHGVLLFPVPPTQTVPRRCWKSQEQEQIRFRPLFRHIVGSRQVCPNIVPVLVSHAHFLSANVLRQLPPPMTFASRTALFRRSTAHNCSV
jgi:hypothetical protein